MVERSLSGRPRGLFYVGVSHMAGSRKGGEGFYQGFSCGDSSFSSITRNFSRYLNGRQIHEARFLGIAMFVFETCKE
jgi:hypothetical protein